MPSGANWHPSSVRDALGNWFLGELIGRKLPQSPGVLVKGFLQLRNKAIQFGGVLSGDHFVHQFFDTFV